MGEKIFVFCEVLFEFVLGSVFGLGVALASVWACFCVVIHVGLRDLFGIYSGSSWVSLNVPLILCGEKTG